MAEALTFEQIKEIMEVMSKQGITKFELELDDFELKLESKVETPVALASSAPVIVTAVAPPVAEQAPTVVELAKECGNQVKAPIVGTFYSAPAPGKPAYVKVGSKVKEGDTLFIIESMKLMNEVTSPYEGIVTKIQAEDGQGVEYGQPILTIE